MPSRVWISIPRHSLECFTRATRRVILCPPPSSSHAKDYRLFAHRPQSHVSPARISLRRMRSQVAQAQSSKIPLTMRCPGPDKVKEQEAMTGSMSGKEKHDAEHRQGSLPFRLDSCALLHAVLGGRSCWLGCPYQPRRHFDFGTRAPTRPPLPFFSPKRNTTTVTGIQLEPGAREETGRFRDVKRCVATEDRTRGRIRFVPSGPAPPARPPRSGSEKWAAKTNEKSRLRSDIKSPATVSSLNLVIYHVSSWSMRSITRVSKKKSRQTVCTVSESSCGRSGFSEVVFLRSFFARLWPWAANENAETTWRLSLFVWRGGMAHGRLNSTWRLRSTSQRTFSPLSSSSQRPKLERSWTNAPNRSGNKLRLRQANVTK